MRTDRGSSPPAPVSDRADRMVEREYPRLPCVRQATLTLGPNTAPVETGNISFGGVLVRSEGHFAVGAEGLLRFRNQPEIGLDVRVCWMRGEEVGLKFEPRSRQQRQTIAALVTNAGPVVGETC